MAEDYTEAERKLIEDHRAKNAPARRVTVKGRGDDGTEYSFDLEGEEAARVIDRHKGLFSAPAPDDSGQDSNGKARQGGAGLLGRGSK